MLEVTQLVELQAVDTQLQDLNELLGDLPKKVDNLFRGEESLINAVDKGNNRLKEIELALKKAEHHMAEIKQKIDKLKDQLSLVTSNKQYDALTQEIEYLKQAMNEAELEDLELEEEKETLKNDLQEKEDNLESLSEDLKIRRGRLEDLNFLSRRKKKNKLEKEREEKSIHIDSSLIGRYIKLEMPGMVWP
ncbi:MAG: hypothetical protein CM1200mP10_23230 [Candidatus Neomarinimicrobiota bacterium]|nr:MAG: hypothetical protein CM1200mP10_23230 [Candidatus Neomarinimicrobiota bacterium]